jgi:hypothetical protein
MCSLSSWHGHCASACCCARPAHCDAYSHTCSRGLQQCRSDLQLCWPVHEDTLAPVAGMVELLKHMEQPPSQLTPQQASTCRKSALLAIGGHLEGRPPEWMDLAPFSKGPSWDRVAMMSRHRMSGQQLQGLYLGIKGQRESGRQVQGRLQVEEEEAQVAACLAAAQDALQQEHDQQQQQQQQSEDGASDGAASVGAGQGACRWLAVSAICPLNLTRLAKHPLFHVVEEVHFVHFVLLLHFVHFVLHLHFVHFVLLPPRGTVDAWLWLAGVSDSWLVCAAHG